MSDARAALAQALLDAARQTLGDELPPLRAFTRAQLEALARQGLLIAAGIADGSIDAALQRRLLDDLDAMTRSFANTLAGLGEVAAEQLWNALADALWDGIGRLAAATLPPRRR